MKKITKLIVTALIFSIYACSSNNLASRTSETSNQLSFVDLSAFDKDLSASLGDKYESVDVAFYEKVSPNQLPERLQKWMSSVEQSGGRVNIEPPPGEVAPKDPFTIISLIASAIGGAKNFAEFKNNRTYEPAKERDAVISLERNAKGEVVVSKVQFVKRHLKDGDKK